MILTTYEEVVSAMNRTPDTFLVRNGVSHRILKVLYRNGVMECQVEDFSWVAVKAENGVSLHTTSEPPKARPKKRRLKTVKEKAEFVGTTKRAWL